MKTVEMPSHETELKCNIPPAELFSVCELMSTHETHFGDSW
jgi:hypothetical protein